MNYAFNHKETLMNYLQDGRCEISNNAAERRVKSYVMGRKNFLFHNTVDGARASATVLSLIETAKANRLNPSKYLNYLFEKLPNTDFIRNPDVLVDFLPWAKSVQETCQ